MNVVDGQTDVVVELHLVLGKPWSDEDVLVLFFQPPQDKTHKRKTNNINSPKFM